jgi:hypothetical protein
LLITDEVSFIAMSDPGSDVDRLRGFLGKSGFQAVKGFPAVAKIELVDNFHYC